jgi:two-component system chemotaxis sensor kinase CheA
LPDTGELSALLALYLEDARGHLAALDHALLALERDGLDPAVLSELRRPLHTLKGNSGMMGFAAIQDYVHGLEDVFAAVAEGRLGLGPEVCDRLFAVAGVLREAVEEAGATGGDGRPLREERAALGALLGPPPVSGEPLAPAGPAPPPAGPLPAREGVLPRAGNLIRVDFTSLDALMHLAGELAQQRSQLEGLARRLARDHLPRAEGRTLREAVERAALSARRLQYSVMDLRMLPVKQLFDRFPRLVRDLAHAQGKDVQLVVEGEDTRLDKAVIDEMAEPLVHLLTNCIDHGIEPPAVRLAEGKTPTATVFLWAGQEAGRVRLTVADDGAGIDVRAVRARAVERGLLGPDEAWPERDLLRLVFSPGFTTRRSVTATSGRGVGLDVVQAVVERLGGYIHVETVARVGTRFVLDLPLTMAILPALLVEGGGPPVAVPLASVVETVRLRPGDVETKGGQESLPRAGERLPLARLSDLLGSPPPEGERYALVLGRADQRCALAVGRILGRQEVVATPLDPVLDQAGVPVSGATQLGDGRVALILDVGWVLSGTAGAPAPLRRARER